jgi:hypothetical protein
MSLLRWGGRKKNGKGEAQDQLGALGQDAWDEVRGGAHGADAATSSSQPPHLEHQPQGSAACSRTTPCWGACTSTLGMLQWRDVAKERESAVRVHRAV